MSTAMAFILLLILASLTAMMARRLQVPYTVALVTTGLAVSLLEEQVMPGFDLGLHLTPDLLFLVLLPILIFEAAFHFDLKDFASNWKSIMTLAAPGLVVGIFIAGVMFFGVFSLLGGGPGFIGCLLLAAILSATDPVAVISLFREVGVPKRLGVLMEGESLVNDGVAVVVFSVILVALGLDPGQSELTAGFVAQFLGWEILGALLIGGIVGLGASWLTTRIDDHLIEITLSTVAAYGSFLLATEAHSSGVIACLVAGMLTGNFGAKFGMSATTRLSVISFWEYAAFLANSFIFLLVGLDVKMSRMLDSWLPILLIWMALVLARGILVGGTLPLLERFEGKLRRGKALAVTWGGLRGGIAMVLALSISREWPHRELVVDVVFGVCVLTILVQGTTIRKLLSHFGLSTDRSEILALEDFRGRYRSLHDALRFLDQREASKTVDPDVCQLVREELTAELTALQLKQADTEQLEASIQAERYIELTRQVFQLRKAALMEAMNDGHLSERVAKRLIGELDERLHCMLESKENPKLNPADSPE